MTFLILALAVIVAGTAVAYLVGETNRRRALRPVPIRVRHQAGPTRRRP
ncbi:hypothetical protein ABC977_09595 [Thioalkalicoccus limnaeus]|uniref:Uncharacterized protein n=1 Tax=Thioalkalicoccus limnaeus TaxID=120681 RepID=A0ABV4BHB7_9GAMM